MLCSVAGHVLCRRQISNLPGKVNASFVNGHVLAVDGGFLASGVNQ